MVLAEPVQITQLIAEVFDRLQIPYLTGGSLASSLHGIPRATQDVDMVADIKPHHVALLAEALKTTFYIDAVTVQEAIQRGSSFNIIHLATMFKVDIFVLQEDIASQEEMARREKYQISESESEFYVASAEDTILHKLYWFQLGGGVSERQWNDILGVFQVQHEKLDFSYLKRGAVLRGVTKLLKQAFKDANTEISDQ
ncbi:MAG: hypothetical protein GY749_35920 [Desulfobacteraceae bacterium]|nr:hypothetical protein [Desulfobacteraceae bacterium]